MKLVFVSLTMILILVVGCGMGLFEAERYADRFITDFHPADGDIRIDVNELITFTMPADINISTFNTNSIKVTANGGTAVPGTLTYNPTTRVVTFTPRTNLPQAANVTVSIYPTLLYLDGQRAQPQGITFSTISYASVLAMWKFDGNGLDSSPRANHLTMVNATYDSTTQFQGTHAVRWNGTNAYGITTNVVDLGRKFSMTVWVKMTDPIQASCNGIFTNVMGGLATNGFKVFINHFGTSDLTINTEAGDGTNGSTLSTATNFVTTAEWKQVAVVIDKDATDPDRRGLFYFDGHPSTQSISQYQGTTDKFPTTFNTAATIVVGAFKTPHLFFNGEMDDMRVYSDTLSPEDVLQISQQR